MGLFGPSQNEVWSQLSEEINGKFVKGSFFKGSRVELSHHPWTIYLDTYSVSTGKTTVIYTRMRAPFILSDNLYFKVYKKGIFSEMGKFFGMQDIEIGIQDFDEDYIIKGNKEDIIKKLFSNSRIRNLIKIQPRISLEIKEGEGIFGSGFKQNEGELYFQADRVITDIDLLKNLFELFGEMLGELNRLGCIGSEAPMVRLYKD
ncbi:hypothetical protein [Clostridium sp. Marseille-P299]|uniref:hypothetical protein n=1 Tax=Clostridium sp. Marseille-P299 TaxID=1805477 RepID=UPI000829B334|nr:hypothetical protein [Clostridium sp. Marseille-P299]